MLHSLVMDEEPIGVVAGNGKGTECAETVLEGG